MYTKYLESSVRLFLILEVIFYVPCLFLNYNQDIKKIRSGYIIFFKKAIVGYGLFEKMAFYAFQKCICQKLEKKLVVKN